MTGFRANVSDLKTSNYTIVQGDYIIGVGTLTTSITISLPSSPAIGDLYIVKDVNGSAGINYNIIVDGNGKNIDGAASFIISQNYGSFTFAYTDSQWSIIDYAGKQLGNGFGVFSNRPLAGQSGRMYFATDTGIAFYDDGYIWQPILTAPPMTAISQTNFTWQNQGSSTAVDSGSGIILNAPNFGSHNAQLLYITAPSTPYTITARFITSGGLINGNDSSIGLAWSDGTKFHTWHTYFGTNAWYLTNSRFTNSTTYATDDYSAPNLALNNQLEWYQISDDGTDRKMAISRDGINFITCFSVPRTTHLTPTRVGVYLNAYGGDINSTLISWKQT